MSEEAEVIEFLREMKGPELAVVIACCRSGRSMTNNDLQEWTGFKRDALKEALQDLVRSGHLEQVRAQGPWRAGPETQSALLELLRFPGVWEEPAQDGTGRSSAAHCAAREARPANGRTTAEPRQELGDYIAGQPREEQNRIAQAWKALREEGIAEPRASELAKLPHVTADYAHRHVQCALAQGYSRGTAIYRMRYEWPAPVFEDGEWRV